MMLAADRPSANINSPYTIQIARDHRLDTSSYDLRTNDTIPYHAIQALTLLSLVMVIDASTNPVI